MVHKIAIPVLVLVIASCSNDAGDDNSVYRDYMRSFVRDLSGWAKAQSPGFIIIPQNGHALLTMDGDPAGPTADSYLQAIDGVGREDLFYGYDEDNVATPHSEQQEMLGFMDLAEANGIQVMITDYCSDTSFIDNSYAWSSARNYISFATPRREMEIVPTYPGAPYNENIFDINDLSSAKNFLYLINPSDNAAYADSDAFIAAMQTTNYDIILTDLFFEGSVGSDFSSTQITNLKIKSNGGSRLVIAYMSIGEAEEYRYYWQSSWNSNPPSWLESENPDWPGNYEVRYWDPDWQAIIFGNASSYLQKIVDAGFDGVYLDIIDAFEYFEDH